MPRYNRTVVFGFTRRSLLVGSAGAALGMQLGCNRRPPNSIAGVRLGRQDGATDLTYLRCGTQVVAVDSSPAGTVNIWDLASRRVARSFQIGRAIRHFAVDEDRGLVAVASRNGVGPFFVGLFDLADGRPVRQVGQNRSGFSEVIPPAVGIGVRLAR